MKKVVKTFYCTQRFCGLKILKIQIIVQTAQFFSTLVIFTGQRSFLTEPVRKKLKLPALRKETMIFQVFGQNDNKVKEVNIVQIKIKGNNRLYMFVEAVSCPKICSPITNHKYNFAKNN